MFSFLFSGNNVIFGLYCQTNPFNFVLGNGLVQVGHIVVTFSNIASQFVSLFSYMCVHTFCLIEVWSMVVAVQQPSTECTAFFTVYIV